MREIAVAAFIATLKRESQLENAVRQCQRWMTIATFVVFAEAPRLEDLT